MERPDPNEPVARVQLTGEDGNIFFILGRARKAMRRAGCSDAYIERFSKEVTSSGSYDDALAVVMRYCDCD